MSLFQATWHAENSKIGLVVPGEEEAPAVAIPLDETFESVAKDWMALREAVAPAYVIPIVEQVAETQAVEDPEVAKLLLMARQNRIDGLISESRRLGMAVPATSGDRVKTVEDADRIIATLEERLEERKRRDGEA